MLSTLGSTASAESLFEAHDISSGHIDNIGCIPFDQFSAMADAYHEAGDNVSLGALTSSFPTSSDMQSGYEDPNDDPFVVNPWDGLDLWFYRLGVDLDDPNRMEILRMFGKPYTMHVDAESPTERGFYDHDGTLDIRGWAIHHGMSPDDPNLFNIFNASGDHVQSDMSALTDSAISLAQFDAEHGITVDDHDVPISAHTIDRLEDMHLDALARAEDAAAHGNHATASMLRHHANDIDHLMHDHDGHW